MREAPGDGARDSVGEQDGEVLSVRFGRSANCSSVGSVVDVLFVSSVVGTAILGALGVLIGRAGTESSGPDDDAEPRPGEEDDADPPRPG